MATTASLLKAGPVFMSWKHHQQFCSRQISSNNNFFSLKMKSDRLNIRNPTELRLVRVSSSNLRSELSRNYSKADSSNLHDLKKLVCSSNNVFGDDLKKLVCSSNNLFGDDDVGSMSVKLSRKLLAGLLLMTMTMALADSAFAASNGRMGGSISSSSSPSPSSSYSGSPSSSYSGSPSYSYSSSPRSSCCCHEAAEAAEAAKAAKAAEAAKAPESAVVTAFNYALNLFILFIFINLIVYNVKKLSGRSVLMLQVGILDKKRVLQRKLNTIAESADTSTSRGLSQLLDEVSDALLQHHDSCHFVYYLEEYNHFLQNSLTPFYRRLKIKERKRYDRETFMNVDGVKLGRPSAIEVNSIDNEYSVVTILVLARGGHAIPIPYTVRSVLKNFNSISPIELIKDIEVLWSPQSEGDTISEQELRSDFPHMSTCYEKEKKIPHKWSLEEAGI